MVKIGPEFVALFGESVQTPCSDLIKGLNPVHSLYPGGFLMQAWYIFADVSAANAVALALALA